MKYSFMTFSCPDLTLGETLALAKKYGYDGIEPRLDAKHKHGIEATLDAAGREAARKQAQESGVAICCLATSCIFARPDSHADMVRDALARIDLAADVGAPCIRVFGGSIPKDSSREAANVKKRPSGEYMGK